MKKPMTLLLALLLATLAGCASVPMSASDADKTAKAFAVDADKSNIYLYRNEMYGGAIAMPVSIDGHMAGRTGPKTYFLWVVEPGRHEIVSHTENESQITLDTQPGRNYYVWQEVKMGMWAARSQLHEMSEQEGRAGVMECQRAQSSLE